MVDPDAGGIASLVGIAELVHSYEQASASPSPAAFDRLAERI